MNLVDISQPGNELLAYLLHWPGILSRLEFEFFNSTLNLTTSYEKLLSSADQE